MGTMPISSAPSVFIAGPDPDSPVVRSNHRLTHAGMTDVGSPIDLTQQAAGNEPVEIQSYSRYQEEEVR